MSEKNIAKEKLSLYKSKASKTFQTPSQLQTQPNRVKKKLKMTPQNKNLQNESYQLNEQTSKHFSDPTLTRKLAR